MIPDAELAWRDRWIIALDRIEYFFRRLVCRVIGHRWEEEKEWAGDQSYIVGYTCATCHKSKAKRPTPRVRERRRKCERLG